MNIHVTLDTKRATFLVLSSKGERSPFHVNRKKIEAWVKQGQACLTGREPSSRTNAIEIGQDMYREILVPMARLLGEYLGGHSKGSRPTLWFCYESRSLLHQVPWELMYQDGKFLSLSNCTVGRRLTVQGELCESLAVSGTVRILMTSATPPQLSDLCVQKEFDHILDVLSESGKPFHHDIVHKVTRQKLAHYFQKAMADERPYHIWIHSGHGGVVPDFRMILESEREPDAVGADAFKYLVGRQGLRLAMLNLCHGADKDGLAQALVEMQVPAVIGHAGAVRDDHAQVFSRSLFHALTRTTLAEAVFQARLALSTDESDSAAWAKPQLFGRFREDACLWAASPEAKDNKPDAKQPGSFHGVVNNLGTGTSVVNYNPENQTFNF